MGARRETGLPIQGRSRWPGAGSGGPEADALTGARAVAAIAGLALGLSLAASASVPAGLVATPCAVALGWVLPGRLARARQAAETRRLRGEVADVVDLLAVAAGAGLTVFRSLEVAAAAAGPRLASELHRVVDGVRYGRPLAEGLADLARRVPVEEGGGVARAIAAAHQRGLPLAGAMERAADELRLLQRHESEEAARTAPVKMLFPLAFLILPSFLLLTAAPLLVTALRGVAL